jgi:hypothetical protein
MPDEVAQWWVNTVTASVKASVLDGRRLDALNDLCPTMCKALNGLSKLPRVFILAPNIITSGQVLPSLEGDIEAILYLSPTLEFESQEFINYIVAHEFAHLHLGHYLKPPEVVTPGVAHEDHSDEKAADELAAKWGFSRPEGKTWMERTLYAMKAEAENS